MTQEFTYQEEISQDGVTTKIEASAYFWALQDAQSEDVRDAFSQTALDWLVDHAKWPRARIHAEAIACDQCCHKDGKELKWDTRTNMWKKK